MNSEIEKVIDDTDYQYQEYLKLCTTCHKRDKEVGEQDCKFCFRKGRVAGFRNVAKPLWNSKDLMDQRGLQYER